MMINTADYNATTVHTLQTERIYLTFNNGGAYSHNLVALTLHQIARTNKPLAEAIHADLKEQGY